MLFSKSYLPVMCVGIVFLVCSLSSEENSVSYQPPSLEEFQQALNLDVITEEAAAKDGRILPDEQMLDQLLPLLASRSVENVAAFLKNDVVIRPQKISLLRQILQDTTYGFFQNDAVQLVLDVANGYAAGSPEQEELFGLLLEHPELIKNHSPLYIAVKNDYTRTFLPLLAWSMKHAKESTEIQKDLTEIKMKALTLAVDLGDGAALDKIKQFSLQGINPQEATALVWYIVQTGNHPELLSKLKAFGADLDSVRGKFTPLIAAVENGMSEVVQQLIALKVDLDKIADPEFGSALQRAFAKRDVATELILRKAGARE